MQKSTPYGCAVDFAVFRLSALDYRHQPETTDDNLLCRRVARPDAHTLAQDHHAENDQEPVPLRTVLKTLRPYRGTVLTGPPVLLAASVTSNLSLVLHEPAINAAKHGALNASNGNIQIEWHIDSGGLELTWNESGGADNRGATARIGFGTKLRI